MPEYEFRAMDANGQEKIGQVQADSSLEAIAKIRNNGLFPLRMKLVGISGTIKKSRIGNLFAFLFNRIRGRVAVMRGEIASDKKALILRRNEIIAQTFAILDQHLRKASAAQVGGFRPPEGMLTSWFGNVLVCREGESWPKWKPVAKPETFLTPLAQFNLTEAPFVPEKLRQFKLITVFMDEELPYDKPHGHGWLIRGYETLEGLVPIERPQVKFNIKPFPIRWELLENEGPSWEDAWSITNLTEFNEVTDHEFNDRYHNSERTKLGGYPALIQAELSFGLNNFAFQIGTEEKAHWGWGDGGIGYFGLNDNGEWLFEWSCY